LANNEYVLNYDDDELEQEDDQFQEEAQLDEEDVPQEKEDRQQLKLRDNSDKNKKFLLNLNQWDPGTLCDFMA
jgi:hypothetical protein